jgi:hypothetical protein
VAMATAAAGFARAACASPIHNVAAMENPAGPAANAATATVQAVFVAASAVVMDRVAAALAAKIVAAAAVMAGAAADSV